MTGSPETTAHIAMYCEIHFIGSQCISSRRGRLVWRDKPTCEGVGGGEGAHAGQRPTVGLRHVALHTDQWAGPIPQRRLERRGLVELDGGQAADESPGTRQHHFLLHALTSCKGQGKTEAMWLFLIRSRHLNTIVRDDRTATVKMLMGCTPQPCTQPLKHH